MTEALTAWIICLVASVCAMVVGYNHRPSGMAEYLMMWGVGLFALLILGAIVFLFVYPCMS